MPSRARARHLAARILADLEYNRQWRENKRLAQPMIPTELKAIADKIATRSTKTDTGCIVWQGAKDARGYGIIRYNGRNVRVHRAMLAAYLNEPSLLEPLSNKGWQRGYVLHSCDNPTCCNPKHLRLGSAQDNADDKKIRGRQKFNPNLPRKLTEDAVREIRDVAQTWEGMCDMMKKHRVGQLAIYDVLKRKTYKHVD